MIHVWDWLCGVWCAVVGHKPARFRDYLEVDRTLAAMFVQASGSAWFCRRCGKALGEL